MEKKAMIGAVLSVIAIILLAMTFFMPWYSVDTEMEMDEDARGGGEPTVEEEFVRDDVVLNQQDVMYTRSERDYYFTEIRIESEVEMYGETETTSETEDYQEDSEVGSVFEITMIFTIVAVIGTILGLIGAILVGVGKLDRKIGSYLAIIGIIFAFIAPLYLMIELPDAFDEEDELEEDPIEEPMSESLAQNDEELDEGPHESFFGSYSEEQVGMSLEMDWGPSMAWYFTWIAGILNIGVIALVFKSSPTPTSSAGEEYYQQQQPRQQQPSQQQPPQQQQPQQQPRQQQPTANTCSTCGGQLRYIEEYDRWYCDSCQQYE